MNKQRHWISASNGCVYDTVFYASPSRRRAMGITPSVTFERNGVTYSLRVRSSNSGHYEFDITPFDERIAAEFDGFTEFLFATYPYREAAKKLAEVYQFQPGPEETV